MSTFDLGQRFVQWATRQEHIKGIVHIGSYVRLANLVGSADLYSDWDFQIISSTPEVFENPSEFTSEIGHPVAVAARGGRLGAVRKVTILFSDGEIDIVVIPLLQVTQALTLVKSRSYFYQPSILNSLEDLAAVLVGGYKIIKGDKSIIDLYLFIQSNVPAPRLSDDAIRTAADGFVCDYVSTIRKLQRGEFLAAQRWIHHYLAEVNFRLAHEMRQRRSLSTFPDARRIEQLGDESLRISLEVRAELTRESLTDAAQKCAWTLRELVRSMIGAGWIWPPLPSTLSTK